MRFFRRNTLLRKLFAFYLVIVVVSFYFMISVGRTYIYEQVKGETAISLSSAAERLVNSSLSGEEYTDSTIRALRAQFEMAAEASSSEILIIREDGEIIFDTGRPSYEINYNVRDHGEGEFLHEEHVYDYTIGGYLSVPSVCVSIPLKHSEYFDGYLIFAQSNSFIYSRADYYYNILLTVYYILIGLLFLTYIAIYFFCFVPLKKLRLGSKDFAIGRDNPPIEIHSHDEYGELAETLNVIGGELSKFDEYQRKFLSNISHDFRSPLTSIRGYLQAMQDGVIPPEEQGKYIDIILSETERLTKLTNEIMDVNSYDKDNIFLEVSTFDIHETIHQVCDALAGRARGRGIRFIYKLQEDAPLYVEGDREKIHQVIFNLADNAVKFSHENSEIELRTLVKKGKVLISVKDSGIGIPKDDIGKIWDRFYKSDLSRGKDKTGTGLGLSICREIIRAHKQTIDVVSTEGAGTVFTFGLPLAE